MDIYRDNVYNEITRIEEGINTDSHIQFCVLGIGNDEAIRIAQLLKHNKTIKTLMLATNYIGDKGVMAISDSLETNKHLTEIYLDDNNITDIGAIYFIDMLTRNTTLEKAVFYHNNKITYETMNCLNNALCKNRTIKNIVFNKPALYWRSTDSRILTY